MEVLHVGSEGWLALWAENADNDVTSGSGSSSGSGASGSAASADRTWPYMSTTGYMVVYVAGASAGAATHSHGCIAGIDSCLATPLTPCVL